jgi:hypothetical protein
MVGETEGKVQNMRRQRARWNHRLRWKRVEHDVLIGKTRVTWVCHSLLPPIMTFAYRVRLSLSPPIMTSTYRIEARGSPPNQNVHLPAQAGDIGCLDPKIWITLDALRHGETWSIYCGSRSFNEVRYVQRTYCLLGPFVLI